MTELNWTLDWTHPAVYRLPIPITRTITRVHTHTPATLSKNVTPTKWTLLSAVLPFLFWVISYLYPVMSCHDPYYSHYSHYSCSLLTLRLWTLRHPLWVWVLLVGFGLAQQYTYTARSFNLISWDTDWYIDVFSDRAASRPLLGSVKCIVVRADVLLNVLLLLW